MHNLLAGWGLGMTLIPYVIETWDKVHFVRLEILSMMMQIFLSDRRKCSLLIMLVPGYQRRDF